LFTFFDLESLGFSGSQRFVQELTQPFTCHSETVTHTCPKQSLDYCSDPCFSQTDFLKINFDKIEVVIDLSQIGGFGSDNNHTFIHTDDQISQNVELADTFVAQGMLKAQVTGYPPSSVSSFLKKKSIPAIVLADYDQHFSSP
jgi:nicastrin